VFAIENRGKTNLQEIILFVSKENSYILSKIKHF